MAEDSYQDCVPDYVDMVLWKTLRQRVGEYLKTYPTKINHARLLCELLYIYIQHTDLPTTHLENFTEPPFSLSNLQVIELFKIVEDLKDGNTPISGNTANS